MPGPSVSIIVPTYNERENLEKVVEEIDFALKDADCRHEILVVDDKSPDGTAQIAQRLCEKNKNLRVIIREGRKGLPESIKEGIDKASHENVLVMDTDLSHDCSTLPALIKGLENFDIVVGSRFVNGGKMNAPFYRVWGSICTNVFVRLILNSKVRDNTGGFFIAKKSVFKHLDNEWIFRGYGDYCIRFLYQAQKNRLSIKEIGYTHNFRVMGKSKTVLPIRGVQYIIEIIKMRLRTPSRHTSND